MEWPNDRGSMRNLSAVVVPLKIIPNTNLKKQFVHTFGALERDWGIVRRNVRCPCLFY